MTDVPDPAEENHRALREALGCHALGRLPRPYAAAVDHHLEGCAACRAEFAELRPLAGALAGVQVDHLTSQPVPPPELGEAILARIDAERAEAAAAAGPAGRNAAHRPARRPGRFVLAVAAAVATIALAFGVGWMVRPEPQPPPVTATVALTQAEGTPASGTADIVAEPSGTTIVLRTQNLGRGKLYRVEVVTKDRERVPAGGLVGTGSEQSTATLHVAVPMPDTAALEVLGPDGTRVLWSVWG